MKVGDLVRIKPLDEVIVPRNHDLTNNIPIDKVRALAGKLFRVTAVLEPYPVVRLDIPAGLMGEWAWQPFQLDVVNDLHLPMWGCM